MTFSLFMIVEDARDNDMDEPYTIASLMTALFSHPVAVSAFIICRSLYVCDVCEICSHGFSVRLLGFVQANTLSSYGFMYFLAAFVLVCVEVMVISA